MQSVWTQIKIYRKKVNLKKKKKQHTPKNMKKYSNYSNKNVKNYGLPGIGGIRTHNLDILELEFFAGFGESLSNPWAIWAY